MRSWAEAGNEHPSARSRVASRRKRTSSYVTVFFVADPNDLSGTVRSCRFGFGK